MKGRTDKIPSSGLSSISQLAVGGEHKEDLWSHLEWLQLLGLGGCIMFDSLNGMTLESSAVYMVLNQWNFVHIKLQWQSWWLGAHSLCVVRYRALQERSGLTAEAQRDTALFI